MAGARYLKNAWAKKDAGGDYCTLTVLLLLADSYNPAGLENGFRA